MSAKPSISRAEFVALMALLSACVAFSIDTMLPGLPVIAAELSPANPNNAQYVLSAFVLGMGIGTLFVGPVSDAVGRKVVILTGAAFYIVAAFASYLAQSLEALFVARFAMGVAVSAPRAVGLAVIRDLYSGRMMARISSFIMIIFSLVPALAPFFGAMVIEQWGWREIFIGFILFMVIAAVWYGIRLPETLPPSARRRLTWDEVTTGLRQMAQNRVVVISTLVLSLSFGMLFSMLVSVQPIYDGFFGMADDFPFWFAATAFIAMTASIVNASLVERLGMRFLITAANLGQFFLAGLMAICAGFDLLPQALIFPAFFLWSTSIFWMVGLTLGNLFALALEPLGHVAGLASSVVSSLATVLSLCFAIPVGLAFDGTSLPLAISITLAAGVSVLLMMALGQTTRPAPTSNH